MYVDILIKPGKDLDKNEFMEEVFSLKREIKNFDLTSAYQTPRSDYVSNFTFWVNSWQGDKVDGFNGELTVYLKPYYKNKGQEIDFFLLNIDYWHDESVQPADMAKSMKNIEIVEEINKIWQRLRELAAPQLKVYDVYGNSFYEKDLPEFIVKENKSKEVEDEVSAEKDDGSDEEEELDQNTQRFEPKLEFVNFAAAQDYKNPKKDKAGEAKNTHDSRKEDSLYFKIFQIHKVRNNKTNKNGDNKQDEVSANSKNELLEKESSKDRSDLIRDFLNDIWDLEYDFVRKYLLNQFLHTVAPISYYRNESLRNQENQKDDSSVDGDKANLGNEKKIPSFVFSEIIENLNIGVVDDVELSIILLLGNISVLQYGDILNEDLLLLFAKAIRGEYKPPFFYRIYSRYCLLTGDRNTFLDTAMEGFRKYNDSLLKSYLTQSKGFLAFAQKLRVLSFFSINTEDFVFFNFLWRFFLLFSLPFLGNVLQTVINFSPIIFSKNMIEFKIDEAIFWGYPVVYFVIASQLAIYFSLAGVFVQKRLSWKKPVKAQKWNNRISIVSIIVMGIILLVNLIPSIYFNIKSLDYITTEVVQGNARRARLDNIERVEFRVIDPRKESECGFVTKYGEGHEGCNYRYEFIVTERGYEEKVLFKGDICDLDICIDDHIFSDVEKTEEFIEVLNDFDVEIDANYSFYELEEQAIPDEFIELLKLFEDAS